MKTRFLILILAALLVCAAVPALADDGWGTAQNDSSADEVPVITIFNQEKSAADRPSGDAFSASAAVMEEAPEEERLLYTNFNDEPVLSKPTHYAPLSGNKDTVLVTKIRTYHWNDGNGAAPGTVGIYDTESGERICGGQAVGRSSRGTANVYWETLTECLLYPGRTYRVKVSAPDTWSYNGASSGAGMFELYGYDPLPEGYAAAPQQPAPVEAPVPAPVTSAAAPKRSYTVPDTLSEGMFFEMGYMEQNNKPEDGFEPIEWRVIAVQKDMALVISRYVLDYMPFTDGTYSVRWDTSAMRKWLNNDFYNAVFTPEERSRILLVTNQNPNNLYYGTSGGPATQDHIFLLNYDEAGRYFRSDDDRMSKRTKTAGTRAGFDLTGSGGSVPWTLRTPGYGDNTTALVSAAGAVDHYGTPNYMNGAPTLFAVRPAFWMRTKTKTGFRVTYDGNNCLAKVPTDSNLYQPGQTVTVLFDPVEYMPGLIFSGWDRDGDGTADHGYYYNTFPMPAKDVVLKAICYQPNYDQHYSPPDRPNLQNNDYFNVTIIQDTEGDYGTYPDYGFVPNHTDPLWMDGVG